MAKPIDEDELITATEQAALAAAHTMGLGDGDESARVAVESMHRSLDAVGIAGRVVIGAGERGVATQLYVGEELGASRSAKNDRAVDLAVQPIEGSRLCATGAPGAVTVLVAAERDGILRVPDVYMEKIVVGPTARGRVHLDAPVAENLRNVADAFRREVSDLTVVVLERERHRRLVADIRAAGARIRLIRDGDLAAGIAAAVRGTGVHAVMGTGGAPEGVLTAAAMRCLGGEIQGRLTISEEAGSEDLERRLAEHGLDDPARIYATAELARGEQIVFSCTGITDGELLRGVRFFGGGARTSTLFMSFHRRIIRFVDTIHRDETITAIQFH